MTGWWFGTFFIFHNIWDNPFHWLIFFKMVKTTNQINMIIPTDDHPTKIRESIMTIGDIHPQSHRHSIRGSVQIFGFLGVISSCSFCDRSPLSRWLKHSTVIMDVYIWVWVNTYRYIFSGMNIHLPAILMFTRGTRFWHTAIYIYLSYPILSYPANPKELSHEGGSWGRRRGEATRIRDKWGLSYQTDIGIYWLYHLWNIWLWVNTY